jgi:hypothetical protein
MWEGKRKNFGSVGMGNRSAHTAEKTYILNLCYISKLGR